MQGAICLDTLGSGWSPVGTIKMALISLRMLLESPNPKDPQDAEVAKMLMEQPAQFAKKAHEWAVKYAGAPMRELPAQLYEESKKAETKKDDPSRYVCPRLLSMVYLEQAINTSGVGLNHLQRAWLISHNRYQGYNKDLIDRFVNMGFDVDAVVDAFTFVGIDRNGGEDYELEEAYMGDITARLLGEQ